MTEPTRQASKKKRVQAPLAVVWLVFGTVGLILELTGLRTRDKHGPLSNAIWVLTEGGPHSPQWWLLPATLGWLMLHLMFPGVPALGWRGLILFVVTALFFWGGARLLHIV